MPTRVNDPSEDILATKLLLLCASATRSSRSGGFPAVDEPLDDGGRSAAARMTLGDRYRRPMIVSPSRSAQETAAAMQVDALPELALADIDHGRWAGRSFEDVHVNDGEAFARWIADPTSGAPDGESLEAVRSRVGAWLDRVAPSGEAICAVTHAMVGRAAIAHVLAVPAKATLSIDIAPLSGTILSFNRTWRIQAMGIREAR